MNLLGRNEEFVFGTDGLRRVGSFYLEISIAAPLSKLAAASCVRAYDGAQHWLHCALRSLRCSGTVPQTASGRLALLLFTLTLFVAASVNPVRAEMVRLLEITYELDLVPLDGRPTPDRTTNSGPPRGYLLQEQDQDKSVTLFPAMGADMPLDVVDGLLLALRYISYIDGSAGGDKTLQAAKLPYSPDFGTPSGVAPMFGFSVIEASEGILAIAFDDLARNIDFGEPIVFDRMEKTLSTEEFTDAILGAYLDAGVPTPPSRDAIMQQALTLASGQENITFYARLTVQDHGEVELSDIDLASLWRDAQVMARQGPYDRAVTALETLLDILPDYNAASRLYDRVLGLIESGALPVTLSARIEFPPGQPDADMRAIWQLSSEGSAYFVPADATSDAAQVVIPVRDGGFSATLYSGEWGLSINIPGFATYESHIVLREDEVINVPIVLGE